MIDSLVNSNHMVSSLPHLLYYELVHSQKVSSIEWACLYILRVEFCVKSNNLVANDHIVSSFPHLLYCELVHSQEEVSFLSIGMSVHS